MTNDTGVELPGAVVEASKVVEPITVEPILAVIVAVPLVARVVLAGADVERDRHRIATANRGGGVNICESCA